MKFKNDIGESFNNCIKSTAPLFYIENNGAPIKIGSAVFIEYRNRYFLITCSHLIKNYKTFFLPLGEKKEFTPKSQPWVFALQNLDPGSEYNDNIDISAFLLSESESKTITDSNYISTAEVNFHSGGIHNLSEYLIVGYPNTSTKVNKEKKDIEINTLVYHVQYKSSISNFKNFHLDNQYNIPLQYRKKDILNTKSKSFVPKPWGISGAGLWVPKNQNGIVGYNLIGIIIGGDPSSGFVYATSLNFILSVLDANKNVLLS